MSKKKLKIKIRNIFLAIQICCLVVGSGLDMAVICHADDGHTEIEAASAEGCATLPTHHHGNHSSESPDSGFSAKKRCGDCVDSPLSMGRAEAQKKPAEDNGQTLILLAPPSGCRVNVTAYRLLPQLLLPPPDIAPLSSIVLLI